MRANGGNVKRTEAECNIPAPTIRRWRTQWEREAPAGGEVAVDEFVSDATRIRDAALVLLEQRIGSGEIKPIELIKVIGTLDDKISRAMGLDVKRVEHSLALPSAEEMEKLMGPYARAGLLAAERRHEEILDAEVVEAERVLPT